MKKLLSVLCLTLCFAMTVHAREAVPIVNIENQTFTSGSGKTLSTGDVKAAIARAAASLQWSVVDADANQLTATLFVRNKHTVIATITYSGNSFSIIYKDSINMKYGVSNGTPVIHPFYNKWILSLANAIRMEMQKL